MVEDRRIQIPYEITLQTPEPDRFLFLPISSLADRTLLGNIHADPSGELEALLARVGSLGKDDVTVIGSALDLYASSVDIVFVNISAAYLLLIASLEVLSRAFGSPPTSWEHWEDHESWDELFKKISLSSEQTLAIKDALVDRPLRLKRTFIEYAATRVPDSFWDDSWVEWTYQVESGSWNWESTHKTCEKKVRDVFAFDRSTLRKCLSSSYDTRSQYVHRGSSISLLKSTLAHSEEIKSGELLPYSFLRLLVRKLLIEEIMARTTVGSLPDFRFLAHAPPKSSS